MHFLKINNLSRVGIMGEPIYKFNPVSLSPLDVETEEETEWVLMSTNTLSIIQCICKLLMWNTATFKLDK